MLINDKIMFDRCYCINSANHCENEENIGALYFITSSQPMHDSGPVQILIILHVLCVAPGNKDNQKPCINSTRSREFPYKYTAFVSINTWQLIACSIGIYAIIFCYFPFLFRKQDFCSDCTSSWSLLWIDSLDMFHLFPILLSRYDLSFECNVVDHCLSFYLK